MSFVFPTDYGYHFEDELKPYKKYILKALETKNGFQRDRGRISPLIGISFIGKHWFTPKNQMMFLLGFTSSGINNSIHRGSCSCWALVKILKIKTTPTRAQKEQYFSELLGELKNIIKDQNYTNALYSAIYESVIKEIGCDELNDVLMNFKSTINNYIDKA